MTVEMAHDPEDPVAEDAASVALAMIRGVVEGPGEFVDLLWADTRLGMMPAGGSAEELDALRWRRAFVANLIGYGGLAFRRAFNGPNNELDAEGFGTFVADLIERGVTF